MATDPPLLALRGAAIGFGTRTLFDGAELAITPGMRACLVGRNGSGKSTLMKALAGLIPLDAGERYVEPGLAIGYLPQDPPLPAGVTVRDFVARQGDDETAPDHAVDATLDRLDLADRADRLVATLSGGEGRRAALARALLGAPDVLLLDEPTNHLDLPTILWLEQTLCARGVTCLMISHDRAFLTNVATDTIWLRGGVLLHNPRGYADFEDWVDRVETEEIAQARKLDQKLKAEARWLARGVTARRKRNQGRLAKLGALRAQRQALLAGAPLADVQIEDGPLSGRLVIEAEHLGKSFAAPADAGDGGEDGGGGVSRTVPIVADFSTRVLRGDRIGILGRNGAGKTTLLKLLTGELAPDSGRIRLGTNLTMAVFDQKREQLNPDDTLWRTLAPRGGDSVMVRGRQRHVVAYLRDFLFDETQARAPVATLSGGERNRLLLAKILAQPSNLLVLDEPTNDLDADTLDLLEDTLDAYEGTLIVVSHDRDFLDRIVSSTIAVEGNGIVREYVGGYSDYLRQRETRAADTARRTAKAATQARAAAPPAAVAAATQKKLSFGQAHELQTLPATIASLEAARAGLEAVLADPAVYRDGGDRAQETSVKLDRVRAALAEAEDRWLELEALREALDDRKTGT
jgi:ATP-binding cassette subfamily F protein uup